MKIRCPPLVRGLLADGIKTHRLYYHIKSLKKKKSPAYEHIKRNETRRSGSTVNRMTIMEAPEGYARHTNTLNAMKQGGRVV